MLANFIINGDPRTKKNHSIIVNIPIRGTKKHRHKLLPSEAFTKYQDEFIWQLTRKIKIHSAIDIPIQLKCHYYMKTRRLVDMVGLEQATQDILVKAGILKDDCAEIIASKDGTRVFYDKDNPRVEICIYAFHEGE